jgi:hypothetical protein
MRPTSKIVVVTVTFVVIILVVIFVLVFIWCYFEIRFWRCKKTGVEIGQMRWQLETRRQVVLLDWLELLWSFSCID